MNIETEVNHRDKSAEERVEAVRQSLPPAWGGRVRLVCERQIGLIDRYTGVRYPGGSGAGRGGGSEAP
jgi:hypothetical protein